MTESIRRFLETSFMEADIISFEDEIKSFEGMSKRLKVSKNNVVRSVVLEAEGEEVLAVFLSSDRLDLEKAAESLDAEDVKVSEKDVFQGYDYRFLQPVGLDMRKVVDKKVVDKDFVYGFAGLEMSVLRIDPRFIVGEETEVASVVEDS